MDIAGGTYKEGTCQECYKTKCKCNWKSRKELLQEIKGLKDQIQDLERYILIYKI